MSEMISTSIGDAAHGTLHELAIELKADWSKGYARLGNALAAAGKHAEAVKAYATGLMHDPTSGEQIGLELMRQGYASTIPTVLHKEVRCRHGLRNISQCLGQVGPNP
eukprot:scaffold41566_cov34-Tisochrysis_lutea.AAC.2